MANRGCLRDGFWSGLMNMARMERQVAVVVGFTVVISSMYPHVSWTFTAVLFLKLV
jgi:hypothetical protein